MYFKNLLVFNFLIKSFSKSLLLTKWRLKLTPTEINIVCPLFLVMATICSLAFIRNTGSRLRECWPTLELRPKNKRTAVRLLSPAIYRRALAQVKTTMDLGTKKNHVKKQPRKTRMSTNVLCRKMSLGYHVTSWRKTYNFSFKLYVSGYVGENVERTSTGPMFCFSP